MKAKQTTFVFDLDDTLYSERDFFLSGMESVARTVNRTIGVDANHLIKRLLNDGVSDIFEALCTQLSLPHSVKESLLWEYRLHFPNISLDPSVSVLINELMKNSVGVAILTDGRSITQRNKLNALGLFELPAYISEEYGVMKPDPTLFLAIVRDFESQSYVYVGDNPKKDFVTPNALGWFTVGILDNGRNIHSQDLSGLDESYYPDVWLNSLLEIRGLIS